MMLSYFGEAKNGSLFASLTEKDNSLALVINNGVDLHFTKQIQLEILVEAEHFKNIENYKSMIFEADTVNLRFTQLNHT